jgi:hypothetical protein
MVLHKTDFAVERLAQFAGVEVGQINLVCGRTRIAFREEGAVDRHLDHAGFGRFALRSVQFHVQPLAPVTPRIPP